MSAPAKSHKKEPFDFWHLPARISRNDFRYKSLSCWAFNISVGCGHACRFCYVPSATTIKLTPSLKKYNVLDPDAEWGDYSLLRPWDEKQFRASLQKAEKLQVAELNPDGNRAVIFCSTTDPFQIFRGNTPGKTKLLNDSARALVTKALEGIRDYSTLNVRILTRSPMAREFFGLFKTFGDRLIFGMSLPTLDNRLSKVFEPKAPAPSLRLKTLQAAKQAGIHVYVAMAPTYPECDEADLKKTLQAIRELDPITVFHEPINIRAQNVARIAKHAEELGIKLRTEVFASRISWCRYALESLNLVQRLAEELGLGHCLHAWPDKQLLSESYFLKIRKQARDGQSLTRYQEQLHRAQDIEIYEKTFRPWLEGWWSRISEWPGAESNRRVETTATH